jgi:hypothetical protein
MATVIPKQPKKERDQITIRLDRDVLETLEHYCRYLESSRDWVINQYLTFIFRKAKPFTLWLTAKESPPRRRLKRAPEKTTGEAANNKNKPRAVQGRLSIADSGSGLIRHIVDSRPYLSLILTVGIGTLLKQHFPFLDDNAILQLVAAEKPGIFIGIKHAYQVMLFSTPFVSCSMVFSLLHRYFVRPHELAALALLPLYPTAAGRDRLFLVVGELHHPKRPEPADEPRWLTIPDRGLYTGIAIFGAIGSGRSSCCMYPFAEQILAYKASDADRRAAGLILEVKGDSCHNVRKILKRYGREDDYFEISLDCPYRYNPLHNDLEAYALAYRIASLLNNLFGRGKEPLWQQAYTNLVKFIILLHKVNYDYVTLFDVYECAINPDKLEMKIRDGEALPHSGIRAGARFRIHRAAT